MELSALTLTKVVGALNVKRQMQLTIGNIELAKQGNYKSMDAEQLVNAEGWRPEPGDVLIGKVAEIDSGWSDYTNDYYPIVTITPEGGGDNVAVHCFHQTLKSKMVSLRPNIGARIGIKFEGKQKSKDGRRDVAVYVVKVDGQSQQGQWDRFSDGRTPAQPQSDIPTTMDENTDDIPF